MRIKTGYERLIHKVDLGDIKHNLIYIENLAKTINTSDHLEQTLYYKIQKAHEKLSGFYPKRSKRGLVNALGKVIKFIAGNPDQDDLNLINQDIELLETSNNNIINNQIKQIKINNLLQTTINKVSGTLRSIKSQLQFQNSEFKTDLEFINLILNIDILMKTLEDLEEQVTFSRSNQLNKNILSATEKNYIWNSLSKQHIPIQYEDEIYKFVQSIVSLQNNHIIIIVKLPIVETKEYRLIQLEPVNVNGTRINTNIRYVASHQQTFFQQRERCFICNNNEPVNDECIFNILTNHKAKCPMIKQPEEPIIKEVNPGTILVDTHKAVTIWDSCGESQIISTPTVVEAGNCTITVRNLTFKGNIKVVNQHTYLTPIFGKEIETIKQKGDSEDIHQLNLNNLEEIKRLKLHMISSQTIGGIAISSIVLCLFSIICIRRFKTKDKKESIVTLRITDEKPTINPQENNRQDTSTTFQKDETSLSPKSLFPVPRFVLTRGSNKSTEDA